MQLKYWNFSDLQADSLAFPADDELHIWTLETEKLGKMHKSPDSRAVLTHILSHMLNVPEPSISLGFGAHGKPFLVSPEHEPPLHFNISHSGKYIVLAFSTSPIGIDIEYLDRDTKIDQMAHRFFHLTEQKLISTSEDCNKKKQFFRIWTIKEAFLKAIGTGITIPTNSFYATEINKNSFHINAVDKKDQEEYSSWTLQAVHAPDNYICTICYQDS